MQDNAQLSSVHYRNDGGGNGGGGSSSSSSSSSSGSSSQLDAGRRPLCPIHCAKQFQSQNKIRIN